MKIMKLGMKKKMKKKQARRRWKKIVGMLGVKWGWRSFPGQAGAKKVGVGRRD